MMRCILFALIVGSVFGTPTAKENGKIQSESFMLSDPDFIEDFYRAMNASRSMQVFDPIPGSQWSKCTEHVILV